jgi:hypothetical protein
VKARSKSHTILRLIDSGEVLGECDLTEARAKAIVKAYALWRVYGEREYEKPNYARQDSSGAPGSAPSLGSMVSPGPYMVRTGPRILLGINGPVLCGGGRQVVTIPLMHLDSCTLPTREGQEADIERILALASVTRYGPAYNRGVAENLGRYMASVKKCEGSSAEYFLSQAEKCYHWLAVKEAKK